MPALRLVIGYAILVISLAVFLTNPPETLAQGTGAAPPSDKWNAFNQSDFTLTTLFNSIICQITGISPVDKCKAYEKKGDKITPKDLEPEKDPKTGAMIPSGALGGLTSMMASLYSPPTSTVQYLAGISSDLGLIDKAYAQSVTGSGRGVIKPVEKLWLNMRNIAYMIFVVVFIAVGFMIMFRQKINAQTTLSIQSALPSLIIGLVLIYFSYFISAFIIDIAFFGVQLVGLIFNGIPNYISDTAQLARNSNIIEMLKYTAFNPQILANLFVGLGGTATIAGPQTVLNTIAGWISYLPFGIGNPIKDAINFYALFGYGPGTPVLIGSLLLYLIIVIALFIQFLRLFFKLIMSYIMLLVSTIIGPLLIVVGMLPGRGGAISFWWKNLLGHALVFPGVFAVFLFAGMILGTPNTKDGWNSPPLFGGFEVPLLQVILGMGIILGSPAVPDLIKKLVGAQDLGAIGQEGMAGFQRGYGKASGAGVIGFNKLTAPTQRLRNEYRTLKEQSALGKLGDLGQARLAALERGEVYRRPQYLTDPTTGAIIRDTAGNPRIDHTPVERGWLPAQLQDKLVKIFNKPWGGK